MHTYIVKIKYLQAGMVQRHQVNAIANSSFSAIETTLQAMRLSGSVSAVARIQGVRHVHH
ncbi:hypothetical protein [Methylobacillus flagellatus]|uniref:hypothetical protein n=1 Tax=Methylobacillus flagellatus TaxID=405 RepID=UPI000039DFE2|nr:hypothetical protein [Methylobacillus flagellatus]